MTKYVDGCISWCAPILPSVSLAGIPLGLGLEEFCSWLSRYEIDAEKGLYQFEMSPVLELTKSATEIDEVFLFKVHDRELTNWRLYFNTPDHAGADPRAMGVIVRERKIHAIKVWQFENLREGDKPKNVYCGKTAVNIGLGDPLARLLAFTHLTCDEAEEWFYTGADYGGLEVTGYGDLIDYPDQVIMAFAVIPGSPIE